MATTFTLISSNTLSSSAASVTFSSIPSTYTDLVLRASLRHSAGFSNAFSLKINSGDTVSNRILYGSGSAAGSYSGSSSYAPDTLWSDGAANTANTFSNVELYIPNYTSSAYKQFSSFGVTEQNATSAYAVVSANLIVSNNSITSLMVYDPVNGYSLLAGSSFYLYGLKNS